MLAQTPVAFVGFFSSLSLSVVSGPSGGQSWVCSGLTRRLEVGSTWWLLILTPGNFLACE